MTDDNLILTASLLLLLVAILFSTRGKWRYIHVLAEVLYSLCFICQLNYNSGGGRALGWWFSLLLVSWLHLLLLIVGYIVRVIEKKNRKVS